MPDPNCSTCRGSGYYYDHVQDDTGHPCGCRTPAIPEQEGKTAAQFYENGYDFIVNEGEFVRNKMYHFAEAYAASQVSGLQSKLDQARKERDEESLSWAKRYDSEVGHLQERVSYWMAENSGLQEELKQLKEKDRT